MEPKGQGRVERRLAAILAADVAGYSRLMGADEEGTLERLKTLRRELIDPKIAEHHGRIVKTTGDGLLVEFASVVDVSGGGGDVDGGQHGQRQNGDADFSSAGGRRAARRLSRARWCGLVHRAIRGQ